MTDNSKVGKAYADQIADIEDALQFAKVAFLDHNFEESYASASLAIDIWRRLFKRFPEYSDSRRLYDGLHMSAMMVAYKAMVELSQSHQPYSQIMGWFERRRLRDEMKLWYGPTIQYQRMRSIRWMALRYKNEQDTLAHGTS